MNPFEIVARLAQVAQSDEDLLDLLASVAPAPPEDFAPPALPANTLPPQGVPIPPPGGAAPPPPGAAPPQGGGVLPPAAAVPTQGPFGPGPVGGAIPAGVNIPGLPEALMRAIQNLPQGGPGGRNA